MLKIKDQSGKTVAVLKDEDNEPQLIEEDKKEKEDDEESEEEEGE
jgi:hypothetical protein